MPTFTHLFLLYRPWTAAVPLRRVPVLEPARLPSLQRCDTCPTVLPSPNQLQKMATMRKKERGQRLLRSSRVLRRVRLFAPPQFLPNRDVADRQGAGHGLDMADIGHPRDVPDLTQCSKNSWGERVYKVSKLRGSLDVTLFSSEWRQDH